MANRTLATLSGAFFLVFVPGVAAQCELTRLDDSSGAPYAELGSAVSISGDSAAVVGAGKVILYTGSGAQWQESAQLAPADGAFVASVSIVQDTLLAGAPNGDGLTSNSGSAYLFERGPGGWVETVKIVASDGEWDDGFGISVAMHGGRAVIGAWVDDLYTGSAYVFDRTPSGWVESGKLTASDREAGDMFGFSVGVFGDGIVVGAHREDALGGDTGAAYVFERSPSGWVERYKLAPADASVGAWFGYAVAIDEDQLLVGAPQGSGATATSGTAYVFERGVHGWTQADELDVPGSTDGSQVGSAVDLEGARAVLGAFAQGADPAASGAAHVFERGASAWSHVAGLIPMDVSAGDHVGFAVALAGLRVLVGAPGDEATGLGSGAAFVFDLGFDGGTATYCIAVPTSVGTVASIGFQGSVRIAADDFTLVAAGCPPLQPGLFYYGATDEQVPFGNGFRCVGGPFFRLPPTSTTTLGAAEHAVDFTAPPTAAGQITPGSTWRFQFWFRDPAAGGAAFNLSDGLRAAFCP